jgi:hypothetical protein
MVVKNPLSALVRYIRDYDDMSFDLSLYDWEVFRQELEKQGVLYTKQRIPPTLQHLASEARYFKVACRSNVRFHVEPTESPMAIYIREFWGYGYSQYTYRCQEHTDCLLCLELALACHRSSFEKWCLANGAGGPIIVHEGDKGVVPPSAYKRVRTTGGIPGIVRLQGSSVGFIL